MLKSNKTFFTIVLLEINQTDYGPQCIPATALFDALNSGGEQ